MPYFKNDKINILFIHIPKCGGTSIENYFIDKYKFDRNKIYFSKKCIFNNHSLQHTTYNEILLNKNYFHIDNNNLKIITSVRNPYTRIISALFFNKLINLEHKPKQVEGIINNIINKLKKNITIYDNHFLEQYKFLLNNNEIDININILKLENLNNLMKENGFTDFNNLDKLNHLKKNDSDIFYYSYINENSLNIINDFYDKDFKYFKYDKITIDELNIIKKNIKK